MTRLRRFKENKNDPTNILHDAHIICVLVGYIHYDTRTILSELPKESLNRSLDTSVPGSCYPFLVLLNPYSACNKRDRF
jgi:hypothetical protein